MISDFLSLRHFHKASVGCARSLSRPCAKNESPCLSAVLDQWCKIFFVQLKWISSLCVFNSASSLADCLTWYIASSVEAECVCVENLELASFVPLLLSCHMHMHKKTWTWTLPCQDCDGWFVGRRFHPATSGTLMSSCSLKQLDDVFCGYTVVVAK